MCNAVYQWGRFQCLGKASYKKEARKMEQSDSTHFKGSLRFGGLSALKQVKCFVFLKLLFRLHAIVCL